MSLRFGGAGRKLSCLAYIVFVTLFFLWYLFPSDRLRAYIASELEKISPALDVKIRQLRLTVPPGVDLAWVGFFYESAHLVNIHRLRITPNLTSLFGSNTILKFRAQTCSGTVAGAVLAAESTGGAAMTIEASIHKAQIDQLPFFQEGVTQSVGKRSARPPRVGGILNGHVRLPLFEDPVALPDARFEISNASIELVNPMLGMRDLDFQQIDLEMAVDGKRVQIKRCIFEGPRLDGGVSGVILIRRPWARSILKLGGFLKRPLLPPRDTKRNFPEEFLKIMNANKMRVPFKISGTLENPRFTLDLSKN